jgi:hypothetical protein
MGLNMAIRFPFAKQTERTVEKCIDKFIVFAQTWKIESRMGYKHRSLL